MGWFATYLLYLNTAAQVDGPDAARKIDNTVGIIICIIFALGILFILFGFLSDHNEKLRIGSEPYQNLERELINNINFCDEKPDFNGHCWIERSRIEDAMSKIRQGI